MRQKSLLAPLGPPSYISCVVYRGGGEKISAVLGCGTVAFVFRGSTEQTSGSCLKYRKHIGAVLIGS